MRRQDLYQGGREREREERERERKKKREREGRGKREKEGERKREGRGDDREGHLVICPGEFLDDRCLFLLLIDILIILVPIIIIYFITIIHFICLFAFPIPYCICIAYSPFYFSFSLIPYFLDKIIELIQKGTFGKVIKCHDKKSNKDIAIKVIRAVPKYR